MVPLVEVPGAFVKKGNGCFPVSGVCVVEAAAALGIGEPEAAVLSLLF